MLHKSTAQVRCKYQKFDNAYIKQLQSGNYWKMSQNCSGHLFIQLKWHPLKLRYRQSSLPKTHQHLSTPPYLISSNHFKTLPHFTSRKNQGEISIRKKNNLPQSSLKRRPSFLDLRHQTDVTLMPGTNLFSVISVNPSKAIWLCKDSKSNLKSSLRSVRKRDASLCS